jgi:hypothetical protein
MKAIFVSVISGAIGAGIVSFLFQPSFANDLSERAKELLTSGYCNVTVDYGRMTPGPRCFHNEVMVGVSGDNIYCSNIQVSCN